MAVICAGSCSASSFRNPTKFSQVDVVDDPTDVAAVRGRELLEAAGDLFEFDASFPVEGMAQQRPRRNLLGVPAGAPIYMTRLVPKHTVNLGLLALDGKAGVGAQTVLNNLSTQNTQLFTVQTSGEIQLSNLINGQRVCLDVRAAQYANGVPVLTWPCNGANNQRWNFVARENSYYNISPVDNAGFCLDVQAFGTAANTPIQIWSCNGGANQAWALSSAG